MSSDCDEDSPRVGSPGAGFQQNPHHRTFSDEQRAALRGRWAEEIARPPSTPFRLLRPADPVAVEYAAIEDGLAELRYSPPGTRLIRVDDGAVMAVGTPLTTGGGQWTRR
jgi:hypothetical protein